MGPDNKEHNPYRAGLLCKRISAKGDDIRIQAVIAIRFDPKQKDRRNTDKMRVILHGDPDFPVRSSFGISQGLPFVRGYRLFTCRIELDMRKALELDLQNRLDIYYENERMCSILYDFLWRGPVQFRNSRIFHVDGKSVYFRQTVKNTIWLVVRPRNRYDDRSSRIKVFFAWILSKTKGGSDHILMYEKESSRYEESASILYEALMDRGHENIYYIINRDNEAISSMEEKYRGNLIFKDSFRHLVYFLSCKTFIGTENIDHAMQLRAANRHLMKKMQSTDLTHIFLQHGVMYMVSLDAESRIFFQNQDLKRYRAVVSSEAEALHFMLLGGFKREELYVTGLAKFDRSYREDDADAIMIMPTWRRWETNQAEKDFEQTGYYRMLRHMVEGVPEDLRRRIIIKPHPLMEDMMQKEETDLSCYLRADLSHDEALRMCRVLITDYSSIAYDAFYRGANVIFYWEEKEECMDHYGHAHLMINEYNIFGDICYSPEELKGAVASNYVGGQDPVHVRRYRNIVTFSDNDNTARIIDKLMDEGIITGREVLKGGGGYGS